MDQEKIIHLINVLDDQYQRAIEIWRLNLDVALESFGERFESATSGSNEGSEDQRTGPNWPAGGEIDILEGVNDYTNNQAAIHTNPGCTLPTNDANSLGISGSVIGFTDCATVTTGNQGCGIRASSSNTYGAGFNANGGGIYAMKWDSTGVAVYFFPRGSEPADITAGAPQPDTWGTPQARWPSTSCNAFQFFNNHQAIFDTTLCGDWAGAVWTASGIPGQEQSCAQRTGFATCEAFVRASGSAFAEAYWEVKSVEIYQFSG